MVLILQLSQWCTVQLTSSYNDCRVCSGIIWPWPILSHYNGIFFSKQSEKWLTTCLNRKGFGRKDKGCRKFCTLLLGYVELYVLLTVRPGMTLVNNQHDEQFFMYVYFHSLHVSGSHVPIIRGNILLMWHLVYVTLWRWTSVMQVRMRNLHTRRSSTQSDIKQVSHWYNNSPDDGHMAARNM